MDWTKTSIVIRKRTLTETRDLALRVTCKKWKQLAAYYALLAVPIYFLDLIFWLGIGLYFDMKFEDLGAPEDRAFWAIVVYLTVALETAFAGSLTTQYLGLWTFDPEDRITFKETFNAWKTRLGQLVYYLVVTRIVRARFFYAETILLERAPFRGTRERKSTSARVVRLNVGAISEGLQTGSYLVMGALGVYFTIGLVLKSFFADDYFVGVVASFALWPIFLFACRLFNVVCNFFNYVNHRVIDEGWDVVLTFNTESAKLSAEEGTTRGGALSHGVRRSSSARPLELEDIDAEPSTEARQ